MDADLEQIRADWRNRKQEFARLSGTLRNQLLGLGFRTRRDVMAASDAELMRPVVWERGRRPGLSAYSVRLVRRAFPVQWNTCG